MLLARPCCLYTLHDPSPLLQGLGKTSKKPLMLVAEIRTYAYEESAPCKPATGRNVAVITFPFLPVSAYQEHFLVLTRVYWKVGL